MVNTDDIIGGKSFLVLCHSDKHEGRRGAGSGPTQPLLDYLNGHGARYVFLIEQPHPQPQLPVESSMEVHRDGELVETRVCRRLRSLYSIPEEQRRGDTPLRYKFRDIIATCAFFRQIQRDFLDSGPIECAIAVESLNALLTHAWRRRLRVRSLVYFTFDWTPNRYANPLMNRAFLAMDRMACYRSEFLWSTTDRIGEARHKLLRYDAERMGVEVTVPYGIEFQAEHVLPFEALDKWNVVFTGGHYEDNGVMLLPEIAREVASLDPRVRFLVTGDGPLTPVLRARVAALGLQNMVIKGHLPLLDDVHALMGQCVIAIAPFPDTPLSTKKYGDGIKMRSAFACGLAMVTTCIPPVAREVEDEDLGLVTGANARDMAEAIVGLCADEGRLRRCRENVIRKARAHGWDSILSRAFARTRPEAGGTE